VLATAVVSALGAGPLRAADAESLLLPGVDIRSIDFAVGAWCRYRVVDEAMGQTDSSEVMLAIVGRESTPNGPAYWLEIENIPAGRSADERDFTKVLVEARVRSMAPGDSLYHFVRRFYIRKGRGAVEPGDPRDLKRLTVVSPTSESDWRVTPNRRIQTAAGDIECELREFEKEESRDVPAGRIVIRQRRIDRVQVWVSPGIPVFHLARCEIERVRESRAVPPVRGVPDTGARRSRTTSEIVSHGTGAKPRVPSP
jgi:hypothetical protein